MPRPNAQLEFLHDRFDGGSEEAWIVQAAGALGNHEPGSGFSDDPQCVGGRCCPGGAHVAWYPLPDPTGPSGLYGSIGILFASPEAKRHKY